MSKFDFYEVTVKDDDTETEYKLQFDKDAYEVFIEVDKDRDYLRNFIPELNPYGGPIFPYLSALVDSKSGKKLDFYVNEYEHFNKEKYENELVRSTETGQQQQ